MYIPVLEEGNGVFSSSIIVLILVLVCKALLNLKVLLAAFLLTI